MILPAYLRHANQGHFVDTGDTWAARRVTNTTCSPKCSICLLLNRAATAMLAHWPGCTWSRLGPILNGEDHQLVWDISCTIAAGAVKGTVDNQTGGFHLTNAPRFRHQQHSLKKPHRTSLRRGLFENCLCWHGSPGTLRRLSAGDSPPTSCRGYLFVDQLLLEHFTPPIRCAGNALSQSLHC